MSIQQTQLFPLQEVRYLREEFQPHSFYPLKPRGSYSVDTKDVNLEILHFKQFYKHFVFEKDEEGYVKKTQKNYMDVRVVFGLV